MSLLILTQKVDKNDAILGFFHAWILEFSKKCERLTVICLEKGEYDLPGNVKVISLGKEENKNRLVYLFRFYKVLWQERNFYSAVFVHMNVEYVILGYIPWKIFSKKISLWYMHKSVTSRLKLAEKLVDSIFTGSAESFRLPSAKLHILHHGIDSDLFSFKNKIDHEDIRLLSISRITSSKQIDLMIKLLAKIKNKLNKKVIFRIAGEPCTEQDRIYLINLKKQIINLDLVDNIDFVGPIHNTQTPYYYHWADVFLNFSLTGSVDKAVLEAMACGTPVLVSNEAFKGILSPIDPHMYLQDVILAEDRLSTILDDQDSDLGVKLSQYVKNNHDLTDLIGKILKQLED
jgi:glycosyltransferase involved in cell wall biosynthesis